MIPTSLIDEHSICYLAGCGENISFDLSLIEQIGCDVHAFDPTPRAIKHVATVAGNNPKYIFHEVGIWNKKDVLEFFAPADPSHVSHSLVNLQKTSESIKVDVERLSALMAKLEHERIDLLKIDIEGAEYLVLDSIIEDRLDVLVICVEFDEYFHAIDKDYKDRIRNSIDRLQEYGFEMIHSENNGNYTFART